MNTRSKQSHRSPCHYYYFFLNLLVFIFLPLVHCHCPTGYILTPLILARSIHLSCPCTSPVWHCSAQPRDERMIQHLLQQVGKQTVQRKSTDEGRDRAWGHSPYGGPVLRPACVYIVHSLNWLGQPQIPRGGPWDIVWHSFTADDCRPKRHR